MQINIKKLPKSEIEIEGKLESDIFESYFDRALKHMGEHIEIDGFRKGKVPENILLQQIPEIKILEEMAEMALAEYYPKIVEENNLDVISRPEIAITKLARKNPLEFKIKTSVLPEIKLPDYKKIAKKILEGLSKKDTDTNVTDEEVENTILDIRKSRAPKINMSEVTDENTAPKPTEENLPEFNDDFVKALGPFENVEDFKARLKENLILEKGNANKEKTRLKIVEEIIKDTEIDLPEILIDSEVNKIIARMESDISAMGLKFEDYLKHINKTVDDLKKEFRSDGEKKSKLSLVMYEIAKKENIKPTEEDINKEVDMILAHYKDADKERAYLHAENVLTNEEVLKFLETH